MWRYGVALADAGWRADAVDLRGHGTAPRALDYTIDAYAADLAVVRPDGDPDPVTVRAEGGTWDLVIAHSLGGAASTVVAAGDAGWTRRLVLVDPAIHLAARDREIVRTSQERAFADTSIAAVRAEHPTWHPQDIELKALSAQQASAWAVEETSAQNPAWDVREATARLSVPTHVLASDPEVYSIFRGALAEEVLRNPVVTMSVVAGAGHSPHRDKPEDTIAALFAALG
jgi:pimeloyl-ACP methyl ester carboxylesterase